MQLEELIAAIRSVHRERCFAMEQRKRSDLALASFLRTVLGWRKGGDEEANKYAKERALKLISICEKELKEDAKPEEKRKPVEGVDAEDYQALRNIVAASIMARQPFQDIEKARAKDMARYAKQLPVYEWASDIDGFGDVSLAVIIAEAGDLSKYDNPAKLYSRMGVGVKKDGKGNLVRQGGLPKGSKADLWVEHGYNAKRRAQLYVIGDTLVKMNKDYYREVFLERRATEHAKALDEGLIPATTSKGTADNWAALNLPELTVVKELEDGVHRGAGHMTKRAQRYMEKRLLRELWKAWRAARFSETPIECVPPAEAIAAE